MRILVVEDDQCLGTTLIFALKSRGEVKLVNHARAALQEVERGDYDLVISDLNLPALSGDEVRPLGLDVLKYYRDHQTMGMGILMSSNLEKQNVIEACNTGLIHALEKPFRLDKLNEAVDRIMHRRSIVQQLLCKAAAAVVSECGRLALGS